MLLDPSKVPIVKNYCYIRLIQKPIFEKFYGKMFYQITIASLVWNGEIF